MRKTMDRSLQTRGDIMSTIKELETELKKGVKITLSHWRCEDFIELKEGHFFCDNGDSYELSFSEMYTDEWVVWKEPINVTNDEIYEMAAMSLKRTRSFYAPTTDAYKRLEIAINFLENERTVKL